MTTDFGPEVWEVHAYTHTNTRTNTHAHTHTYARVHNRALTNTIPNAQKVNNCQMVSADHPDLKNKVVLMTDKSDDAVGCPGRYDFTPAFVPEHSINTHPAQTPLIT